MLAASPCPRGFGFAQTGRGALSGWLRTKLLPAMHASLNYCRRNGRSCHSPMQKLHKIKQNNHSHDFTSHSDLASPRAAAKVGNTFHSCHSRASIVLVSGFAGSFGRNGYLAGDGGPCHGGPFRQSIGQMTRRQMGVPLDTKKRAANDCLLPFDRNFRCLRLLIDRLFAKR
jgi:hypothetical protein